MSVSSNNSQNNFIEKQYFIERENIIYNLIGNMKMEEWHKIFVNWFVKWKFIELLQILHLFLILGIKKKIKTIKKDLFSPISCLCISQLVFVKQVIVSFVHCQAEQQCIIGVHMLPFFSLCLYLKSKKLSGMICIYGNKPQPTFKTQN